MTGRTVITPKSRLSQIVTMPGGPSVAKSVRRAEANLEAMRPASVVGLRDMLNAAEYTLSRMTDAFDDRALSRLYANATQGVGMGSLSGAPSVDTVLLSLCELLDGLKTRGRNDRVAIEVHLRAWRLLMTVDLPPAGVSAVLDGLLKVSAGQAHGLKG